MKYLLDTNVVSETSKKRPDPTVLAWLATVAVTDTAISAATVGELRRGIELVTDHARREALESWYQAHVRTTFAGRTLPLDAHVMECWGAQTALLASRGANTQAWDALIAATALTHGLTLVTRNTGHFQPFGVRLINPWKP